ARESRPPRPARGRATRPRPSKYVHEPRCSGGALAGPLMPLLFPSLPPSVLVSTQRSLASPANVAPLGRQRAIPSPSPSLSCANLSNSRATRVTATGRTTAVFDTPAEKNERTTEPIMGKTIKAASGGRRPPVPEGNARNGIGCAAATAVLVACAVCVWKFALDSPTTWSETKEGFGTLLDTAGEKWDEWDLANFTDVLDTLDGLDFGGLFQEDPSGGGSNATLVWRDDFVQRNNGGLHLTLQNALDDTWQKEFEYAVSDWQESDSLELSTEQVAVDHTCQRVDGVMVVCNANFGATGWVGINENSILRGKIVSSVAKMNEYYLRNADFDHRRFTMCHELGHGEFCALAHASRPCDRGLRPSDNLRSRVLLSLLSIF
ncbi:hypothetical protein ACHAWF_012001, partial [Thalassiosira exigua]